MITHGTREGRRRWGCKCLPCVEAALKYDREYTQRFRESLDDPRHGTLYGYKKMGCRCAACCEEERLHRKPKGYPPRPINHGTFGGYEMHLKRKVPVCDECREAARNRRGRGGPPKGTRIGHNTYLGMHADLRKRRGPAREYECPCGKQADEWALNPDAESVVDSRGLKFSSRLEDYTPMCRPCHRRMDLFKTHCPRGHELSGENLLERNGKRACRTCRRDRGRVENMTPEEAERRRVYGRERMRAKYRGQRAS